MEERKLATCGGPSCASSACRIVPISAWISTLVLDLDMVTTSIVNWSLTWSWTATWTLDMGAWTRKGSAERMAVAQRALPPPAGHTLHCPSVLFQRKVPFHADSGNFPGVRAATPLDSLTQLPYGTPVLTDLQSWSHSPAL